MSRTSFKINRTARFSEVRVEDHVYLPSIRSQDPPLIGLLPGALGYDPTTQQPYYAKGDNVWTAFLGSGGGASTLSDGGSGVHASLVKNGVAPNLSTKGLQAGSGITLVETTDNVVISSVVTPQTGNTKAFSFIKLGDQTVNPGTMDVISNWTGVPSPPYHDDTGSWNFLTGRFTALEDGNLLLCCNVAWKQGVSNLGTRLVQIFYTPISTGVTVLVKQSARQANPNANVQSDQDVSTAIKMFVGDYVELRISHTASIPLIISGGKDTGLCGIFLSAP